MYTQLPLWGKPKTVNCKEIAVAELLNKANYEVIKNGWPDFAGWNRETDKVVFVEVKPKGEKLSTAQRRMKKIFEKVGLEYKVWWVTKSGVISKSIESD